MTLIKKLFVFIAIMCLSTQLSGAPIQFENQIVSKIDIQMKNLPDGDTFDRSSVTARIKTREGALFSQTEFDNDLKNLAKEFDHVEPELVISNGKLTIVLKVWAKPIIRSISWHGNKKEKTKKLQDELGIKACTVFDRQAFNCAFHKLKAYYVKNGFFEASLDYKIIEDPCSNMVDIDICIEEGRAGKIKKILFENFTCEEEEEILAEMVTKPYFLLTSWYTGEGIYNEDAMQQDRYGIVSYLQNHGYADAVVDIQVIEAPQSNRIIIRIIADKGEIYSFGPVTIKGNTLFTEQEIRSQFLFKENAHYSPEAIRDTAKRIGDFYGRRGYIDAIVDYEQQLDCDSRVYSLDFTIEEGEKYRVGLIKVFGNRATNTTVILNETLLIPGEVFNSVKLELTEKRLQNIGYFSHVNVYAVKSEGPGGLGGCYRDVHVEVEETNTGSFNAGFGISTAESVFGEFRITERNFNHEGLTHFWKDGLGTLRGGGEFLNLSAMVGSKSRKYLLSWTKPYFKDTPWMVGFDIQNSNNRYISNQYEINATGFTIHGAYPVNPFLRFGIHYRFSNTYVTLEGHPTSCKLIEQARNQGIISAIGISLNYDTTGTDPVDRRNGWKSRVEQEIAGFGGDHCFMSLGYLNTYFVGAGINGIVKFKADMRFIVPLFDTKRTHIPIDERLFLGGDNMIRGFKPYRLGPQFGDNDPSGGMALQMLSAEYTYFFNKRMTGFLFCDSGHLSFDVWNFGTMWTSIGFGINLKVSDSMPPVVLGVGFPINPDHKSDVKHFFFNIGGQF